MNALSVFRKTLRVVLFAVYAATPVAAAYGQSAQQFWINEQRRAADYRQYRYRQWDEPRRYGRARAYAPYGEERAYGQETRQLQSRVEIESPEYYTYEPDTLRTVRFSDLCDVKVASNGSSPISEQLTFAEVCAAAEPIALRVLPEVGDALKKYYAEHSRFVWIDGGKASARARAAMAELARAARFGLSPADYQVSLPAGEAGAAQRLMRFELNLSAKVLTYVLDATRGRVAPNRISGYHDLTRKTVDLAGALVDIARTDDVGGYLASRNPDNPRFRALVTALQNLQDAAPRRQIAIADDTWIEPGDSDPALSSIVAAIGHTASPALKQKYADILSNGETAERYDGELVALVRDFQREKGLSADGVVGPRTIGAMTVDTSAEKIGKLRLAMERLRWLPRDFGGQYVFLNEPAFEVTYINGARKPLTMPVIIGKKSRQTYFFTEQIEAVEYNPYWNVPRSILINEMLPKLYDNPGYLDRVGYEVSTASGRTVSSRVVDWVGVARDRTSVDVRQPPGADNALGRLKIKFPNAHAIYLHDTPHKSLFRHSRRAFSHGCVRLKHPRVLAAALLGKPVDYVDSRIAEGKNDTDPVNVKIPVYLAYFTAWPDQQGDVHYYDDVYGRDGYLRKALEKTEAARRGAS